MCNAHSWLYNAYIVIISVQIIARYVSLSIPTLYLNGYCCNILDDYYVNMLDCVNTAAYSVECKMYEVYFFKNTSQFYYLKTYDVYKSLKMSSTNDKIQELSLKCWVKSR